MSTARYINILIQTLALKSSLVKKLIR